jgi:hypothetical protein
VGARREPLNTRLQRGRETKAKGSFAIDPAGFFMLQRNMISFDTLWAKD